MPQICMLSTGHYADDDRFFYKETLSLAKRYNSIVVISPQRNKNRNNNEKISYIYLKSPQSIIDRILSIPQAFLKVYHLNPIVCHVHDYELLFILPFLRLFTKTKIIYDSYEAFPEMIMQSEKFPKRLQPILAKIVSIFEKLISKCAHHIITADETIANHFSNTHSSVTTLFNYPVVPIFQPDAAKVGEIEKQTNGNIPIIYHGGMSRERGLFHMLEAMKIVKQTNPKIILLLVGNLRGILREQVDMFIDNHELQKHIKITGHVHHEDLVNYITVCKVGLVPLQPTRKFLKNIPTKQFEYMLCGLPVIGANIPPITNYTGKANSGVIIDSTNPEELASAIIRVIDDSAAWERMSRNGKQAVSELWNWGNMEIRLYNIYDRFLN